MNARALGLVVVVVFVGCAAARSLPANFQSSAKQDDQVHSLPGWDGDLPSNMYSGYLNVTATKHLHYLYMESEGDPEKDPVVLWLNGGPGCSSLDGFIYEHGPFQVDTTNYTKLHLRPVRWTSLANVVYLEAPVGVGFSYATGAGDYDCNDDQTALDNLHAMELFFDRFPELKSHEFFITGESYAGIYVPTLAEAVLKASKAGNYSGAPLKGIAVGNGCSGNTLGICGGSTQGTYYEFKYLLGKAFISDDVKELIGESCNWTAAMKNQPLSDECTAVLKTAQDQIGHINLYNVYGDCVGSADQAQNPHSKLHGKVPHTPFSVVGPDACIDSRAASGYLNQAAVQKALHVVPPKGYDWAVCRTPETWTYNSTRPNLPRDTYPALIKNYRVLIFNGDWDACVPFTDNESWVDSMGLPVLEPWHSWMYSTPYNGDQVGGYAVKFDVGETEDSWFRFITVRGGRHEVPESAPDKALEMLNRLLHNKDF